MVRIRGAVDNLALGTGHGSVDGSRKYLGKPNKRARRCPKCEARPHQPCVRWSGSGSATAGSSGQYATPMRSLHRER